MKERAGFAIRSAAFVIDVILLLAISLLFGLMAGSSAGYLLHRMGVTNVGNDPAAALAASGFFGVAVFVLVTLLVLSLLSLPYNLMEAFFGWTPGKLATGLRVRNQDGGPATFGQVFWRWLIKHNAVLLGVLTLTGIPFTALSPFGQALIFLGCFLVLGSSRQALHDMASQTAVFEVTELTEDSARNFDVL